MPISTHNPPQKPPIARNLDLLLENANVLTLEAGKPRAESVAVRGGSIVAVGRRADTAKLVGPGTRILDCQGLTLLPGIVDAHCHLLATAASLHGLDCSPKRASNINELQRVIRDKAEETSSDGWIRGFGYDELDLIEERHPNRWDLDSAAPNHPVRLDHRSGHASVLNSYGLRLAGINRDTPDPVDGVIDRDQSTGEPSGLLLEMSAFLRDRLGKLKTDAEFEEGISRLDRMLLSYGITSVQDAGPNNDLDSWETIHHLQASESLRCRVTMMAGVPHLDEFLAAGCGYGMGDQQLRLGHVKVMLTLTTGTLQPDIESLGRIVNRAHQAGFPVALHAVEGDAIAAAAQALLECHSSLSSRVPDRIEHCAECPPSLATEVSRSGAMVVTQPGFLFWNGDRYKERVAPSLLGCLYSVEALVQSGVEVAFGSDSPVIDPNPWPAIYSAVTRTTRSGSVIKSVDDAEVLVESALRMHTVAGARAEGSQGVKGTIRPGKLADLVLMDKDPTNVEPCDLRDIHPVLTVLGGSVAWEASGG